MTAARDGVDRFGSPALGVGGGSNSTSATPSGIMSPAPSAEQRGAAGDGLAAPVPNAPATTGNLNENLRNIGKFFKRDMSTFGRFGGRGSGEEG